VFTFIFDLFILVAIIVVLVGAFLRLEEIIFGKKYRENDFKSKKIKKLYRIVEKKKFESYMRERRLYSKLIKSEKNKINKLILYAKNKEFLTYNDIKYMEFLLRL